MIFLFEQYLRNRRNKVRRWEEARTKWIGADSYGYRDKRDWARSNPYPVIQWEKVAGIAIPIVIALTVVTAVCVGVAKHQSDNQNKPKTHTAQVQQDKNFKVGEKVQVVYGDFTDSVGEVVKVNDNGGAIIKLTTSTYTKEMAASNNSNTDYAKNNGSLLNVDTDDNLVHYKDAK